MIPKIIFIIFFNCSKPDSSFLYVHNFSASGILFTIDSLKSRESQNINITSDTKSSPKNIFWTRMKFINNSKPDTILIKPLSTILLKVNIWHRKSCNWYEPIYHLGRFSSKKIKLVKGNYSYKNYNGPVYIIAKNKLEIQDLSKFLLSNNFNFIEN